MSLIAWYKLNGDLKDYSKNNYHCKQYGDFTINSKGKTGKYYYKSTYAGTYLESQFDKTIVGDQTMCCWVNIENINDNLIAGVIGNHNHTNNSNLGITITGAIGSMRMSCNIGYTDETRVYNEQKSNQILSANKWYHLCLVYRATDNIIEFYINGILDNSFQLSKTVKFSQQKFGMYVWSIGYTASSYRMIGGMSDVRYYDEALSPREIRKISRAMVFHYTFDENQEAAQNLWANENGRSKYLIAGGTTPPTVELVDMETPFGNQAWKVTIPANCDTGYYGCRAITGSATMKYDGTKYSYFTYIMGGSNLGIYPTGQRGQASCVYDSTKNKGLWKFYGKNSVTDLAGGEGSTYMTYYAGSTSTEPQVFYVAVIQFEQSEKCTEFTYGTRNGLITDMSGNEHHIELTPSNSPSWLNTDNKYGVGHYKLYKDNLTMINNIYLGTDYSPTMDFSISTWIKFNEKPPATTTGVIVGAAYYQGFGLVWLTDASQNISILGFCRATTTSGVSSQSLTLNQWYHATMTYDGSTGSVALYLNGTLIGTSTGTTGTEFTYAENMGYIGINKYQIYGGNNSKAYFKGEIDDVRMYNTVLNVDDVIEIYNVKGYIDGRGNIKGNKITERKHRPLTPDYTKWYEGATGTIGDFYLNGLATENSIKNLPDPWGKTIPIWCATNNDVASNDDGGWNTKSYNIDNTRLYRYSLWVKRSVRGNGTFYLGLYGYNSGGTNIGVYRITTGVNDTNPYFISTTSTTLLPLDEWVLVVGHVFPHDYTGTTVHPESGVYDVNLKKLGNIGMDYKWRSDNVKASHRSYLYYSTDPSTVQQWCYPRIDMCDGHEPSLKELSRGLDSRNYEFDKAMGENYKPFDITDTGEIVINTISETGITDGIELWYNFKNGCKDISGKRHHAALTGSPLPVLCNGVNGNGYDLIGKYNAGVHIPNFNFSGAKDFTMSSWIFIAGTHTNYDGAIISSGNWNGNHWALSIKQTNDGVRMRLPYVTAPYSFELNKWYLVTATRKDSTINIYVNNEKIYETVYSNTPLVSDAYNTMIGRETYADGYFNFNGKISETRIYNKALTLDEIGILYDLGNEKINMKVSKEAVYIKNQIKER